MSAVGGEKNRATSLWSSDGDDWEVWNVSLAGPALANKSCCGPRSWSNLLVSPCRGFVGPHSEPPPTSIDRDIVHRE